jgi:NTE family protein
MNKKKIAIACQGGGSQTAFTAGVLKTFFENKVHKKTQIVGLSGTSGGAVCACLSWYSLLKAAKGDQTPVEWRLMSFWEDNSTQNFFEQIFNESLINYIQLVNRGLIPTLELSPDSPLARTLLSLSTVMLPRRNFYDFKGLLESYINFEEIRALVEPTSPVLLIGASNVLKGEFKKFNSRQGEIHVEAILASSAVPSIFPAVRIGEDAYWDGLFSDNPPSDELLNPDIVGLENIPQEIWIIQINPTTRKTIPHTPEEVTDRRNEMIGNVSLLQDIQKITLINGLIKRGAFKEEFLDQYSIKEPIIVHIIRMSPEIQEALDYSSKLNRDRAHINHLIEDGEKQARIFLKAKKLSD